MSINRRTFLSQSALLSGSFFLKDQISEYENSTSFKIPSHFSLTILATNWGFKGSWDEFCAKAKETGFDGIEVWLPGQKKGQEDLFEAIEKYELKYAFLAAGRENNFEKHLAQFQESVENAVAFKPLFVNCHSGRDYFTFEQNKQFIDFTTALTQSSSVRIYHETHRGRMLFAAHIAKNFIGKIPGLRLTMDISHWCNVHESLLDDQQETIDLAISRTDHIHSRVGHAEGPQVTDPRDPGWKKEVKAHFQWWDQVVKHKIEAKHPLTMTAEFGPANYMATVPYTHQPLADLWDINAYMMRLWKERYS
ncbi:MAG: TIM barrel protein [Anditalea sp.]